MLFQAIYYYFSVPRAADPESLAGIQSFCFSLEKKLLPTIFRNNINKKRPVFDQKINFLLEADERRTPGKSGSKRLKKQQLATLNSPVTDSGIQCKWY